MSWHDDEDDDLDECPHCGAAIYDDSVRCPRCENYLSREETPPRHSWWFLLCAGICLILALGWATLRW